MRTKPETPELELRVRRRSRARKAGSTRGLPPRLASVIEQVNLEELVLYDSNPRLHNDKQTEKLAYTIQTVGFVVPMIIDHRNVVIAGHGRYAAAKHLGLRVVPAIRVDYLTDAQVKAFRIADNRLGELSTWDEKKLTIELRELVVSLDDPEIIELTSFEVGEIDARIEVLDEVLPKAEEEIVEPPADGPSVSRVGDLWQLGAHRLICGSSLLEETYVRLLDAEKVRAVWSDPPYNVAVNGHVSGLGKHQHREFVQASGEMSEEEFTDFLARYLELTKAHSTPGALHYACMDAAHSFELLTAARRAGLSFKTTCTWAKTNGGMGSLYRQQTEFVHVFKHGGDEVPHINNVQLGKFGRYRTTLWSYAGVNTFRRGRMQELQSHPTCKPVPMVADAIKDCTDHGDSVLDAFCGSGTTILAAEKVQRVGYGIELDPGYVDVSVRRWEDLTGRYAVNVDTGLSFAETEAQRRRDRGHDPGSVSLPSEIPGIQPV